MPRQRRPAQRAPSETRRCKQEVRAPQGFSLPVAVLRCRRLGLDVQHFEGTGGEIARGAAGVRHPPGLPGFQLDVQRIAARHAETNAAPGEADQNAGAVVMRGYGFAGGQRQAQYPRAVVFEIHANLVGRGDTDDVARQFVRGDDIGGNSGGNIRRSG